MINQMKFQYNNFTLSQVLEEAALASLPGIPSNKKNGNDVFHGDSITSCALI